MEQKKASKANHLNEIAALRSELLRMREEQSSMRKQLAQAHKMEAVGRLAGSVAHDFNNLLTTIIGYSELILSRMSKGDPFRTEVQEILNVGERAAELTKQLLEFNRQQSAQTQAVDPNPAHKEVPKASGSCGETILLVEDEAEVRQLSRYLLKRLGYTILEASGITDAIKICTDYSNPIHLMLTDIVLPGMNGFELYGNLLEIHPEMKVLYMSGYPKESIPRHEMLIEGNNFLQKPFTSEVLANRVRSTLDRT
jgi:CheY-like chemotaxis protein